MSISNRSICFCHVASCTRFPPDSSLALSNLSVLSLPLCIYQRFPFLSLGLLSTVAAISSLSDVMSNKAQAQDSTEHEAPVAYSSALNMDQSAQQQQTVIGVVTGPAQIGYAAPAYQAAPMMPTGAIPSANQPAASFPASPALAGQHQLAYQQVQHFQHQQQQQQLQVFWANQIQEIEQTTDFKNHSLPLARIKKIMKADEDVRMISAEAPVVFAKACEMFILELTLRSWIHTEENKRRTLQKNDIAAAITRTDIFDFLVDIVPRDELKEEGLGIPRAAIPAVGAPAESIPYYYVPPHGSPGMIVGKPVDQTAAAIYATQQTRPVAYMAWQQPQAQAQQTRGHGQQPQQQQQHQQGSTGTAES